MIPLDRDSVLSYVAHMERAFRARVRWSRDPHSPMPLVQAFVGRLGVVDAEHWIDRYAITIGTDIFLPWVPGEGDEQQLRQTVVLVAHECTHVEQFLAQSHENKEMIPRVQGVEEISLADTEPFAGLGFAWAYLTDPESRATFEAEAYSAGIEVGFKLFDWPPDPQWVFEALAAYQIDEERRAYARDLVTIRSETVRAGGHSSRACREAMRFFGELGGLKDVW